MSNRFSVSLSIPDVEADNPVMAVDSFVSSVTGDPNNWTYIVVDEATGERFRVDMQNVDAGGIVYPTTQLDDYRERLSALVAQKVDGRLLEFTQTGRDSHQLEFVVLWRNAGEYGTHRACLAPDSSDAMLFSGGYWQTIQRAMTDYQARGGVTE